MESLRMFRKHKHRTMLKKRDYLQLLIYFGEKLCYKYVNFKDLL